MRVTQSSMSRNYLKSLHRNMNNLNITSERMQTGRRLNRVSDNISDAARAFAVREQTYKNEQALLNIRDAVGELTSVESNLMSVNEIMKKAQERLTQAATATMSPEQRKIVANEMESLQLQVLQIANSKYSDKFLFGATNNSSTPFTLNGKVVEFNGVPVDNIYIDTDSSSPTYRRPVFDDPTSTPPNVKTKVPMSEDIYIDVALGLEIKGDGKADPMTAVKLSVSGLDVFGFGKTANGGPANVISFLQNSVTSLRNNDVAGINFNLGESKIIAENVIINVTDIGTRSNFLSTTSNRIEGDILQFNEMSNKLEFTDIEKEATNYKMFERAWMVSLQLGSKVLPVSLFDFMR